MSSTPDPAPGSEPAETPDPAARPPRRRLELGPQPLEKPARGATSMRDMIGSLLILGVLVLIVGGLASRCSFAPGGPRVEDGSLPVVDAPAQLRTIAPNVPVPLRVPELPADWRSNSVAQDRVEAAADSPAPVARAVVVGYLTPVERFLRLAQSDASEEALLAWEAGTDPVTARGAVDVGGLSWVVYDRDDEPIWIATVPAVDGGSGVRLLITGSAAEDDYRVLADAVATGEQLPLGGDPS